MAHRPYAYDKYPPRAMTATRLWLGVGLLVASLLLIGLVLLQLRGKRTPLPAEDGVPVQPR